MTDEKHTDEGTDAAVAATTPEEQAKAAKADTRAAGESRPVRAVAKYLRFSAQKGRLVVDQIRGKRVLEAATALAYSDRDAAREVMKVLKSAVANAENNHGMRADELYVSAAFVDEGPTFKRFKPRARGRADRINKRTCHVTVIVDNAPIELLEGRAAKKAAASKGDRSARVAGSKKGTDAKAPAKKDTAKKAPAKKPKVEKPADEAAPAEATATATETTDAADAAGDDA
jgi:large subunit ribosomal protein L22